MTQEATHPNVSPSGTVLKTTLSQSPVLVKTVLPHHFMMLFAPISPFLGYCNVKKMTITEIATPESSAAERTSVEREVISVSLFQVKQGSQLTYNCISSTKRSGVYG